MRGGNFLILHFLTESTLAVAGQSNRATVWNLAERLHPTSIS